MKNSREKNLKDSSLPFLERCLKLDPMSEVRLKFLYNEYQKYSVEQERKPPISKQQLLKRIRNMFDQELNEGRIFLDTKEAVRVIGVRFVPYVENLNHDVFLVDSNNSV